MRVLLETRAKLEENIMLRILRYVAATAAILLTLGGVAASQGRGTDTMALRERLEQRFDIVPLSDGVALRPKSRGSIRLIEVTSGAVLVNGEAVTGRELRDRVGEDAEQVLRLSYLAADDLRTFAAGAPAAPVATPLDSQPPLESAAPRRSDSRKWSRRSGGDRIRVFGNVAVEADEEVTGQVVAVFGSARVDGKVGDQVVAVLGSVVLGPEAVVGGDVVSVGGRVIRDGHAETRGGVTEVSLDDLPFAVHVGRWDRWGDMPFFMRIGAIPRLFGTALRLSLLLLVTGIALLLARRSVEASAERVLGSPLKVTAIGLLAELLVLPTLLLTVIVLSVSIIGIPLLLLLP